MNQFRIISLITVLFFFSCSRKSRLDYKTVYSLPVNSSPDSIKIIKSSDLFYEIPSSYVIYNKHLYIADKFNNRIMKYNRKNESILKISNEKKIDINLVYKGSNRILQPLLMNEKLFSFKELNNLYIKNDYIYAESVLMRLEEEDRISSLSLILKYNEKGEPKSIIGNRTGPSNKIFPFRNMEKFSVDKNNNIFVYMKNEDNWWVFKLDSAYRKIYRFNSIDFLKKTGIIINKKKKERYVIENIDNSENGDFLIIGLLHYKEETDFLKTIYYKVDIQTDIIKKLFILPDEKYNFVLLDNQNRIYIWETEDPEKHKENIVLRLFSLTGKSIINYAIRLDSEEVQWFSIKLQKDGVISGINLKNCKFNVVVWK